MNIEQERRWTQAIVNRWAIEKLMCDKPEIQFFNDEELPDGVYCRGSILLNEATWFRKDIFERFCILGHEFTHWLQDMRDPDFESDNKYPEILESNEYEADTLGDKLAAKEIERWYHPERYPVQSNLI